MRTFFYLAAVFLLICLVIGGAFVALTRHLVPLLLVAAVAATVWQVRRRGRMQAEQARGWRWVKGADGEPVYEEWRGSGWTRSADGLRCKEGVEEVEE